MNNMEGYTTQLVPPAINNVLALPPKKKTNFRFKESREHILILLILFFFSVNVALAFVHFSISYGVVDGIPAPNFSASISNLFKF